MTEAEWLACRVPYNLFEHVRSTGSTRKRRILGCACVSWVWRWGMEETPPAAVQTAEAFADGSASNAELSRAANDLAELRRECEEPWRPFPRACELTELLVSVDGDSAVLGELDAFAADMFIQDELEWARLGDFARDIFGNPFRPVTFSPAWRTSTVTALAAQMYESREFGAMPILADALQDAGCDSDDVLTHCRDAKQVHVRGCWVVDLVLGKA
jgi:hypothetical protein